MEPKIVSKPAFTVVGLKYRGKNENGEIPQMWGTFSPRMVEILHKANPDVCYGVCGHMEASGEFDYVAGFEVSSAAQVPDGMVSWALPASKYAVFTCTLPTIGQAFEYIHKTWLPQSGYEAASSPEFELYDDSFNPQDDNSELYIYIPIG